MHRTFSQFLNEIAGLLVPCATSFNCNSVEYVCVGYVGIFCLKSSRMVGRFPRRNECITAVRLNASVDDVTSHAGAFPLARGRSIASWSLLPSARNRPTGSSRKRIVCHWCLTCTLSARDPLCRPLASTTLPQWQLWGSRVLSTSKRTESDNRIISSIES